MVAFSRLLVKLELFGMRIVRDRARPKETKQLHNTMYKKVCKKQNKNVINMSKTTDIMYVHLSSVAWRAGGALKGELPIFSTWTQCFHLLLSEVKVYPLKVISFHANRLWYGKKSLSLANLLLFA